MTAVAGGLVAGVASSGKNAGYLDHNATSPMRPEAIAACAEALCIVGNPSSIHRYGRLARHMIENARVTIAELVGCPTSGVIFTSGGTEANTLALHCTGRRRVLVSAVEHASVRAAVPEADVIPVNHDGLVRAETVAEMLEGTPEPALVSVMLANNETGVIQPLADIAEVVHAHGALLHCDAVQAAGKIPVRIADLGADLVSLSAHKLGGPPGVGALITAPTIRFQPQQQGGGQERGRRAGTENLVGIAGFAAAANVACLLTDADRLQSLRDRLEQQIKTRAPRARIYGADAPRLPNTSCIGMPGVRGETQVIAFDLAGLAVSAGAACSSGKVSISPVLLAMGVGEDLAECAVRVSLGWTTSDEEIDWFANAWNEILRRADGRIRQNDAGLALW